MSSRLREKCGGEESELLSTGLGLKPCFLITVQGENAISWFRDCERGDSSFSFGFPEACGRGLLSCIPSSAARVSRAVLRFSGTLLCLTVHVGDIMSERRSGKAVLCGKVVGSMCLDLEIAEGSVLGYLDNWVCGTLQTAVRKYFVSQWSFWSEFITSGAEVVLPDGSLSTSSMLLAAHKAMVYCALSPGLGGGMEEADKDVFLNESHLKSKEMG